MLLPRRSPEALLKCRIGSRDALASGAPTQPKSEKPRKSREGKRSKRLERQQQEPKEKYRKRQCRANHEQHHQLSKLGATHDVQRQRGGTVGPPTLPRTPRHKKKV